MVLGMSYGELFVVIGVGMTLFGTQDLPKAGRMAGRLAGWAAGYMLKARGHFQRLAGDTELVEMHKELQESMYQLQQIRDELRMGASFLQPGTYLHTPRIRPIPGGDNSLYSEAAQHHNNNDSQQLFQSARRQEHFSVANGRKWKSDVHRDNSQSRGQSISRVEDWVGKTKLEQHSKVGASHSVDHLDPQEVLGDRNFRDDRPGIATRQQGMAEAVQPKNRKGREEVSPLPVSAASLGLTEARGGQIPCGSDVMVDALLEESLARLAQNYVESEVGKGGLMET